MNMLEFRAGLILLLTDGDNKPTLCQKIEAKFLSYQFAVATREQQADCALQLAADLEELQYRIDDE